MSGSFRFRAQTNTSLAQNTEVTSRRQKEIVELLITAKADVNANDKAGKTPLFYALDNEHKEITDLLRKAGARE